MSDMQVSAKFDATSNLEYAKTMVEHRNNSVGDLNKYDGINCPKCQNRGNTYQVEVINDYAYCMPYACECLTRREAHRLARKSGCAELLKTFRFDNYICTDNWQKLIFDKAKAFLQTDSGIFYIGGQVGSGKTHICTAIVNGLLNRGIPCRYIIWRDLLTRINSAINDPDEFDYIIEEMSNIEVLYIDDFFKIKPSDPEIDKAFRILNARYNKLISGGKFFTIISSERTPDDLHKIDKAIASRVKQFAQDNMLSIDRSPSRNYRMKN